MAGDCVKKKGKIMEYDKVLEHGTEIAERGNDRASSENTNINAHRTYKYRHGMVEVQHIKIQFFSFLSYSCKGVLMERFQLRHLF